MIQTYSVDPYNIISTYHNFMQYHGKMRNNRIHASRVLPLSPRDPISKKHACGCQKKISAMPCYQQPITTSLLQGFRTSKFLGWQESNLDLQGWNEHPSVANDGFVWLLCTQIHQKNTWSRDVSRSTNGKMLMMHSFIWSNATFFEARSRRGNQICNTTEVFWALVDSESCCCFRPGNYVLESVPFSQFPIWEPNPWWAPELPSRFLWCTAPGLKMIEPPTSHLASVDYLVQSMKGIHLLFGRSNSAGWAHTLTAALGWFIFNLIHSSEENTNQIANHHDQKVKITPQCKTKKEEYASTIKAVTVICPFSSTSSTSKVG